LAKTGGLRAAAKGSTYGKHTGYRGLDRVVDLFVRRPDSAGDFLAKDVMNALTLFGLVAVTAMLVFYAMESRAPAFILAFAVACVMGSVYGFLQGAWPFGAVEAIWSVVAVRRWWVQQPIDPPRVGRLNLAAPERKNGDATS
jgi:hypothetical protein